MSRLTPAGQGPDRRAEWLQAGAELTVMYDPDIDIHIQSLASPEMPIAGTRRTEMSLRARFLSSVFAGVVAAPLTASSLGAQTTPADPGQAQRIEEMDRKIDVLTQELRTLKEQQTLPATKELKSMYGLGPAASKVYSGHGLSLGGYGEFNLKTEVADEGSDPDVFDFLRLVLYTGYKFNDWIVFNSEIEFEHASTENDGEVSVEFGTLDFLLHPAFNVRTGLILVPMGFLNEVHEPPFFHGNVRPAVETQIIPSTWRANGIGVFGEIGPLTYRTYALSSLNALGFESENIREARQNGSEEIAHDFSWVGRVDYAPLAGLVLGGSLYLGNSGQGETYAGEEPDVFTQLYEGHAEYKRYGLELRALATFLAIDDAGVVSTEVGQTVAQEAIGAYGEIAYDVLRWLRPGTSHYLAPWLRYSWVDTQYDVPSGFARDDDADRNILEVGLSYKPISQVVVKLDYRNQDSAGDDLPDEIRVGAGFAF
jgi:hypothetical protein